MPGRILRLLIIVSVIVPATVTGFGQQRGQGRGRNATPPGPPHDPHDLSGIWLGRAAGALNNPAPSFTPAGKAAFDANKPSFGPRAVPPAVGNDPLGGANPPGIPRALISHATKIQFPYLRTARKSYRLIRATWTEQTRNRTSMITGK